MATKWTILDDFPTSRAAILRLMKDEGYGAGYIYDHATAEGFSGQNYFPDGIPRQTLYQPTTRGFEEEVARRLEHWAGRRANRKDES